MPSLGSPVALHLLQITWASLLLPGISILCSQRQIILNYSASCYVIRALIYLGEGYSLQNGLEDPEGFGSQYKTPSSLLSLTQPGWPYCSYP